MTPLLSSAQGVTLIGGGAVSDADLALATALAPAVMAADSGSERALAAGLMPLAVAGDFDSLSDLTRARVPAGRLHHIAEQDTTDFENACRGSPRPSWWRWGSRGRAMTICWPISPR